MWVWSQMINQGVCCPQGKPSGYKGDIVIGSSSLQVVPAAIDEVNMQPEQEKLAERKRPNPVHRIWCRTAHKLASTDECMYVLWADWMQLWSLTLFQICVNTASLCSSQCETRPALAIEITTTQCGFNSYNVIRVPMSERDVPSGLRTVFNKLGEDHKFVAMRVVILYHGSPVPWIRIRQRVLVSVPLNSRPQETYPTAVLWLPFRSRHSIAGIYLGPFRMSRPPTWMWWSVTVVLVQPSNRAFTKKK